LRETGLLGQPTFAKTALAWTTCFEEEELVAAARA
jgi:hypothetical protein